jgi:fatty-acyl-CoA synthase
MVSKQPNYLDPVMDWSEVTFGGILHHHAKTAPEQTAIVDGAIRVTYTELDCWTDELAHGLHAIGVNHGDQVALWMTNSAEWIACLHACARIGATVVPINTRYKQEEVEYILHQSDASVLIMFDRFWSIDFLGMLRSIVPELDSATPGQLHSARLPRLHSVALWRDTQAAGTFSLDQLRQRGRSHLDAGAELPAANATDPVIIVYTSGTTGHPKGAMHSHIVLRNCANMARWMHTDCSDVVLGHMPFYHVAGAFAGIGQALVAGGTIVILPHWVPDKALEVMEREQVTIFGGIPTHFIDCLDSIRRVPRQLQVKSAWIGGAPVTPDIALAAFKELGLQALQAVYGMTETTSMTTLSEFDAPLEVLCDNKGKPIGEFEVKVCDPATGEACATDAVGEVWVRGHIVMLGYYKNPEATAKVLTQDGWFRTGDLGVYDGQGYLKITGRLKDMFIVGGTNAYPAEIERMIQSHPKVNQAIIVGVPDPRLGEVGFAFVQPVGGQTVNEDEIIGYCRDRMADYKVPRHVEVVSEFQLTSTGKIQRFLLADQARKIIMQRNTDTGDSA